MRLMHNLFQKIVIALIVSWMTIFVLLPNLMVFITSFLTRSNDHLISPVFTFNNYSQLLNPLYAKVIMHSLYMAFNATIFCLIIGYPFAWSITGISKQQLRSMMLILLILPFWTSSLIRIYSLKNLLSAGGLLNRFLVWLGVITNPLHIIYTQQAVIIGLIYILFPFMVLPIYSSLEKLNKIYLEASRDLGASKIQRFLHIIIPLTMPGIVAGCLLVFVPAMGMFFVSDLMGGAKNLLIGNVIKNQFLNIRDWPLGSATSIIITLLMGFMLLCYWYTISRIHIYSNKVK
ncbi:spermidine/putrescine ABC transporter permease PotB [Candidatus Ishikawella capsulata]|uniref:Spermidine/putrescine ABC transporter membrane protein n=1 Tax=Candidatus Ishikawaella capsulata Mpkobe TaxID=476281 RepID=C5WD07_9ENTR|nr:spermidine/putrescine ABC transporter permease PotB [Candidatus Ishikawaella capsulata]BAH83213.1 spermidine/putrescine ABC transporter membrane protein [Candidatus Ishikawaella capsulata Mpkobe]